MTITYPLSLPASPAPKRATLRETDVVGESRSPFTFERQTYEWSGQWWELDIALPPMDRATSAPWRAFLAALRGKAGTFLFVPPTGRTPLGIGTGTPLVAGAGQSGGVLVTDGWTAGQTGILKAGDYLQLGTELHKVLTDANSDGGGNATFNIWPDMRAVPADNAAITVTNPAGLFALASNARSWDESEGPIYDISFSAVEAF